MPSGAAVRGPAAATEVDGLGVGVVGSAAHDRRSWRTGAAVPTATAALAACGGIGSGARALAAVITTCGDVDRAAGVDGEIAGDLDGQAGSVAGGVGEHGAIAHEQVHAGGHDQGRG